MHNRLLDFFLQRKFGIHEDGERSNRAIKHNRLVFSARYIQGTGIEVGGLTRPLPVPPGVMVKYVDRMPKEELYENFPETKGTNTVKPDIVDDAETLSTIGDASQDFVIANHVIEHLQNPIRFFHNASRVLRPGGIIFMALPDKRHTFDQNRPVTSFEHLKEDFEKGPEGSMRGHYREFVRLAETHNGTQAWSTEEEYDELVEKLIADDYSIHFHVWDFVAILDMLLRLRSDYALPLLPLAFLETGDEVISIIRRVVPHVPEPHQGPPAL
ncbi:MAG: methyltransferase type 11 [Alphaproteobacteria bacterium HGW-Alphaproteobacteria-12]|nr:MAG: methyltransferase type 11 [Alphaproteobacteria bacterium HGW-Alphaproteobacteria-12]